MTSSDSFLLAFGPFYMPALGPRRPCRVMCKTLFCPIDPIPITWSNVHGLRVMTKPLLS